MNAARRLRIATICALLVAGAASGCAGGTVPEGSTDITATVDASLHRTGRYELKASRGTMQCVCVVDGEDNPGNVVTPGAALDGLARACQRLPQPTLARAYSPTNLPSGVGLFVIFAAEGGRTRVEYQTFDRGQPSLGAITTLYAAGCFRGRSAIIGPANSPRPLVVGEDESRDNSGGNDHAAP